MEKNQSGNWGINCEEVWGACMSTQLGSFTKPAKSCQGVNGVEAALSD